MFKKILDFLKIKTGKSKHTSKKKRALKRAILIAAISLVATLLIVLTCGYFILNSVFKKVGADDDWSDGNSDIAPSDKVASKVTNIALFGIDTRKDSNKGRSDSIIILSIDKAHDKVKLSSIARDSYVEIDGHGKDKITHAYVFGGPKLAVKTLNQNFDMDITDYATVNFYGLIDIVDAMGGVTLHVDSAELKVMNEYYIPEIQRLGHACELVPGVGTHNLSGSQALAYARNRYTGGDVERGNRQKEVLNALFEKLSSKKSLPQLMKLANIVLEYCETSLTSGEITQLATWYLTSSPTIENFSIPTDRCNPKTGKDCFINGVWYYIYNLDTAIEELHNFIEEPKTEEEDQQPNSDTEKENNS